METHETDVAVVGAGLAGLIAGTLAARAGARTVVIDAHEPGGRARTDDHESFRLNLGAHALYEVGATCRVLTQLEIDPPGAAPLLRTAAVWRDGAPHPLPATPATFIRTGALSGRSKVAVLRLAASMVRLDPTTLADRSFAEWMDDRRLPGDLRALLVTVTRTSTYCDAPELLSADAAVGQIRRSLRGVRYLHGGWRRIIDPLREALVAAGGTVLAGTRARSVTADAGRWAIDAGAHEIVAPAVVLATGGPAATAALLGEPPAWGELGPDIEASCLDVGLDGAHPLAHGVLLSVDDPLYLSSHTPPADLAPAGHRLVSLLRYLRPGERSPAEVLRAELWAHARRAGITPDDAVMHRYLHRMTVFSNVPTPAQGGLAGRPPVAVPGHDGLFVAGDWVGPDELLADASSASGAEAARLAVAHRARIAT